MTDERSQIPGSGDVDRVAAEESTPTPPPDPDAAQRPHEPPSSQQEAAGGRKNRTCLIVGLAVGCGCLLIVLLLLALFGGLAWLDFHESQTQQTQGPALQQGDPIEIWEPGEAPPSVPSAQPEQIRRPGETAALAWARNRRSDWKATVDDYSDDWRWVRLMMAPPDSDWTTWLELEWDPSTSGYRLIDEGPIAYEEEEPGEPIPEIYQPGEDVAIEAALGYVEQPDWVAQVQDHSSDWRRVTVWVGPPASEWLHEVELTWDDEMDVYVLEDLSDIPYPG